MNFTWFLSLTILLLSVIRQAPAATYWRNLRQSQPQHSRLMNGDIRRNVGLQRNTTDNISLKKNSQTLCPLKCSCQGLSIDCSSKSFKNVPRNISLNRIKL